MAMFLFANSVVSTHPTESMMVTQKLPPLVYQFYPYANYPHILGVQVNLFWNGSKSEGYNVWIVEMLRLVRSLLRELVGG